jgi:hypothetical protein
MTREMSKQTEGYESMLHGVVSPLTAYPIFGMA